MLIGVDQPQFLAEHVVAERFPAPAGEIVRKFVQLEVIVEGAPHHVMLDRRIGNRADGVEQLAQVRTRTAQRAAREIAVEQGKGLGCAHRAQLFQLSCQVLPSAVFRRSAVEAQVDQDVGVWQDRATSTVAMTALLQFNTWLTGTTLGWAVRGGVPWIWPLCETLHFMGMALLVGIVGVLDLRLLGVAKGLPVSPLSKLLPWGLGRLRAEPRHRIPLLRRRT